MRLARQRLHVMGKRGESEEERRARKEAVKVCRAPLSLAALLLKMLPVS